MYSGRVRKSEHIRAQANLAWHYKRMQEYIAQGIEREVASSLAGEDLRLGKRDMPKKEGAR